MKSAGLARALIVGETEASVSLIFSPEATLSFDRAGRPIGVHEEGFFRARGHDGRWVEKKWLQGASGPRRHLRPLPVEEVRRVEERIAERLAWAAGAWPALAAGGAFSVYDRGRARPAGEAGLDRLLARLLEAARPAALRADEERFRRDIGGVGILPPDQYLSLVVPVAAGCAWSRCTFCDFYSDLPARALTAEESLARAEAAADYFGEGLSRRCTVFLGDADALAAPSATLMEVMDGLAARFPRLAVPQRDGVGGFYAFAEAASVLVHLPSDLKSFAARGLRRVYLGLESADDELRRWMRKRGTSEWVAEAVRRLKSAGISVGVIVLAGAGGVPWRGRHASSTERFLGELPLGPEDIVYVSPLRAPAPAYFSAARRDGVKPLDEEALMAQAGELLAAARSRPRPPRAALYEVGEFCY